SSDRELRRSGFSPSHQMLARYIHIGAVYCNRMALDDLPQAMASTKLAFIAAKNSIPSSMRRRKETSARRTVDSSASPRKKAGKKAMDSPLTGSGPSARPASWVRRRVKAPLRLQNTAASTMHRRACVSDGTAAGGAIKFQSFQSFQSASGLSAG